MSALGGRFSDPRGFEEVRAKSSERHESDAPSPHASTGVRVAAAETLDLLDPLVPFPRAQVREWREQQAEWRLVERQTQARIARLQAEAAAAADGQEQATRRAEELALRLRAAEREAADVTQLYKEGKAGKRLLCDVDSGELSVLRKSG